MKMNNVDLSNLLEPKPVSFSFKVRIIPNLSLYFVALMLMES